MPPLLVARASNEPVGFADQQDCLVAELARVNVGVVDLVVPERNHFDLPLGLADPADPLGRAVLAHLGWAAETRAVAAGQEEVACLDADS
jgi:arylformamidase